MNHMNNDTALSVEGRSYHQNQLSTRVPDSSHLRTVSDPANQKVTGIRRQNEPFIAGRHTFNGSRSDQNHYFQVQLLITNNLISRL